MRARRLGSAIAGVLLLLTACVSTGDADLDEAGGEAVDVDAAEVEPADDARVEVTGDGSEASDLDTDEVLAELLAEGFCDPADVEDDGEVTAMHFVVGGVVQPPCFGEPDDRLDAAWAAMADVTPAPLLADVSLLAGFDGCETCDTLAFVTALDDDASFFLMAVDVQAGADDPDELALTMQHELTHVFTQNPTTQLDISIEPADCATFHNGTGCFVDDAYAWAWIQRFWDADALATIPEDGSPDEEAGEDRCTIDAPFTGSYGASHPEEDIAEVFSAYVFDVELSPALDDKLAFFDDYPELREVRDRAAAAGRHTGVYEFDGC